MKLLWHSWIASTRQLLSAITKAQTVNSPRLNANALMSSSRGRVVSCRSTLSGKTLLSDSEEWDHRYVLYAHLNPHTDKIIYLGMAWHRTVRQTFRDRDKNALHDFFLNDLGIEGVVVIVGSIYMEGRLTRQLLSDIESLLIKRLRPAGIIMCRSTRISRPGMRLECFQEWPHQRSRFSDVRTRLG
jgi:hypothetical protein